MIYEPQTPEEFIKILRENQKTYMLFVFIMEGCHVCSEYHEYLSVLSKSYPGLPIVKLDVQIFHQIALDNGIDRAPTSVMILFDNDSVKWNSNKFIGIDKNGIENTIKQILSKK